MPKDEWQAGRNRDALRRARRPNTNDESRIPTTPTKRRKKKGGTTKWLNELARKRDADRQSELWTKELLTSPVAGCVASIATGQIMQAKLKMMRDLPKDGKSRTSRKKRNRR